MVNQGYFLTLSTDHDPIKSIFFENGAKFQASHYKNNVSLIGF